MRSLSSLLALLALLVVPALASAQDEYTIKLKKSTKGTQTREHKVETENEETKVTDNDGKLLDEKKKNSTLTVTYEQTVLERPDPKKKASVLKRVYEKAVVKDEDGMRDLPYQGKTVLIEKKDGKYRFSYEKGAEITGEEAKWLDKEFNPKHKDDSDIDFEALMMPTKPLKVGGSWKMPMEEFCKSFEKSAGLRVHADKATGTGTLVKAYKKDGRQFGDLIIKMEMPIKAGVENGNETPLQPGSVMGLDVKMSMCIDGSVEDGHGVVSWHMKATALVPADNPQARVDVTVRASEEITTTELPK
jgi:hypothetical protein